MKRLPAAITAVLAALALGLGVALAGTQISIRASDGAVLSYGSSATGATVCTLDATGATNLTAAVAAPNGGLTTAATPDADGNCNGATFIALPTPTPIPTTAVLAAGTALGTTGSVTPACVAGLVPGCSISNGVLQWTPGTGVTTGEQVKVTFPTTFVNKPLVKVWPANAAAATCVPFVPAASITTTTVSINCNVLPIAGTAYQVYYEVTAR